MRVYLLLSDDGRRHFYSDVQGADDASAPPQRGLRGWYRRMIRRFRGVGHPSEGGLVRRLRALWDWLHQYVHPDEAWLIRLRTAQELEVLHPTTLTSDEARAAWDAFLGSRTRQHWPWLVLNLVLAPLTILLAVLPGPNVIGYWFVYRAVRHLLVLLGLRRARGGGIVTTFDPSGALDRPLGIGRVKSAALRARGLLGAFPAGGGGRPDGRGNAAALRNGSGTLRKAGISVP